jgi:hypothetical protein
MGEEKRKGSGPGSGAGRGIDRQDERGTRRQAEIEIKQQVAKLGHIFPHGGAGVGSAIRGGVETLAAQEYILDELEIGVKAEGLMINETCPGISADD